VACFSNALSNPLLYDDRRAVVENPDIRPDTPLGNLLINDFWGRPMSDASSHLSFRPVTTLTYRLNYAIHGLEPRGYLVVNVVLHVVCTLLLCAICRQWLTWKPRAVGLVGILFAVHPVHADAVCNAAGRAELLCAVFFLGGMLTYKRARAIQTGARAWLQCGLWLGCTVCCQMLSMLSKEPGIMLGPMCVACELAWLFSTRSTTTLRTAVVARTAMLISCTALLGWARLWMNGGHHAHLDPLATTAVDLPLWERAATYWHRVAVHAGFILWPSHLSHDWTADSIPVITRWNDPRLLSPLGLIVGLMRMLMRMCRRGTTARDCWNLTFGVALIGTTFLLSSNLLLTVGFVVAERVLYLPSAGCAIVAVSYIGICDRLIGHRRQSSTNTSFGNDSSNSSNISDDGNRSIRNDNRSNTSGRDGGNNIGFFSTPSLLGWLLHACIATCLLMAAVRTLRRNQDWRSVEALASATLRHSPNNVKVATELASALLEREEWQPAEALAVRALALHPEYSGAAYVLFLALSGQERLADASQALERAIRLHPGYDGVPFFLRKLALQHWQLPPKDASAALRLLDIALLRDPNDLDTLGIQAYIRGQTGDTAGTLATNMQILAITPDDPKAHAEAGFALVSLHRYTDALRHLLHVVELSPVDLASWANLGTAYVQLGRDEEGVSAYRQAVAGGLSSIPVFEELAKAMIRTGAGREEVGGVFQESVARDPAMQEGLARVWARVWADAPPLDGGAQALPEAWGRQ